MKHFQAFLYLIAATLAPAGTTAAEHARATVALHQQLDAHAGARAASALLGYFQRVDPRWAGTARRHLTLARPHKLLRRLGDHKPRYVGRAGEAAWLRAQGHARLLRNRLRLLPSPRDPAKIPG